MGKTTECDFESARNKAILSVMKKDRERYELLEKKYKLLLSENTVLRKTYMDVLNDCIDKKHELRKKIKKHKADYNKLLEREQNKGWNEL